MGSLIEFEAGSRLAEADDGAEAGEEQFRRESVETAGRDEHHPLPKLARNKRRSVFVSSWVALMDLEREGFTADNTKSKLVSLPLPFSYSFLTMD